MAAFLTGFGGNEVVAYGDVAEPVRNDAAILVEVHAAGVNPVEVVIRQGLFPAIPPNFRSLWASIYLEWHDEAPHRPHPDHGSDSGELVPSRKLQ